MSQTNPNMPPGPRNFGQLVAEHEDGRFQASATDTLDEVIAQVVEAATMRGGTAKAAMTVKFEFTVVGETVEIVADITTKVPKLKRGRSIFWTTPEGKLCRTNPAQPELPLRDVTSGPSAAVARNLA